MRSKVVILTDGFHPPFNEGSVNILYGWLLSLKKHREDIKVISTIDFNRCLQISSYKRYWNVLYINDNYDILNKLRRTLFSLQPDAKGQALYKLISLFRSFKLTLKCSRICEISAELIHLHNFPWRLMELVMKLKSRIIAKRIIISVMKSRHVVSASRTFSDLWLITPSLTTYAVLRAAGVQKTFFVPPLPMLQKFIGTQELYGISKTIKSILDRLTMIKKEGKIILLYFGHLTTYRFPFKLFNGILDICDRLNVYFLVITPNLPNNVTYLKSLKKYISVKNVSASVHVVDLNPLEKEKLLSMADIVIYPAITEAAIDPPLTLIEALVCDKFVIASDVQSTPLIINQAGKGLLVKRSGNDFEVRFLLSLEKCIKEELFRDLHVNKTFIKMFSPSYIETKFKTIYEL